MRIGYRDRAGAASVASWAPGAWMPFEFSPQPLAGVVHVRPRVHDDARGAFFEWYRASEFAAAGIREAFLQDNYSISTRHVLRGLHYQLAPRAQGKLVCVPQGSIWDVCVDLRPGSATYGRWQGVTLSAEDRLMVYLPPGLAHGFVVLSDVAHVLYKCTQEYDPATERGVRWDDPTLAIAWPRRDVALSPKDAALPLLALAEPYEHAAP
jgi:dTDP-4-dehydrorhamnose 3,5-epimerase